MYDQGGHGDYTNGDNMSRNDDDRKIFVGGLSWETGDSDIREYFSRFGEVESVNLKTDPNTGRSRGFAFVVFTSTEPVEAVLSAGELVITNKRVEAKRAKARTGKVFVGGIPAEVSDEEIRSHFSAFGKIAEVETPYDKVRNQRKGFVFITFESDQALRSLLSQPKQVLGGKEVDVKKATPRDQGGQFGRGGMRGAPMGMRGGMGMSPMAGRGRGMGAPARGGGAPAAAGRGGWGWGGAAPAQQQWGYGAATGAATGYDAYGYGAYGAAGAAQSYGYGYGDAYGAAAGGYGAATAPAAAGPGRGGGARYQPY